MLTSAFNFQLTNEVLYQKAIISKIDGTSPSLVCVTVGGKVFIYTPNFSEYQQNQNTEFLNLNKDISSIATAKFIQSADEETPNPEQLILATENTLILYDVETQSEKFYQDVSDGISVVAYGTMTGFPNGLIVVGGNCSIYGFNSEGEEVYWNVASEKVTALCFSDIDLDKENELIAGCENNIISVYKNEEIISEITEAAVPVCLAPMSKARFAFGLENGMVGVYQKKRKVWRAKSQMKPVSIVHGRFEKNPGYRPLIVGRTNGQIEVRHDTTGENLYKLQLMTQASMVLRADLRQDGTTQYIVITHSGEVKGYLLNQDAVEEQGSQKMDIQDQLEKLTKKKQNLMLKYQNLQDAVNNKNPNQLQDNNQILPENTKVAHTFKHNVVKQTVDLIVQSTKGTFLKSVILFSEKLFDGESYIYSPNKITNTVQVPLRIKKNSEERIRARVMVGTSAHSRYFQIFEFETQLPRFSNFLSVKSLQNYGNPQSCLNLELYERIPRYVKWIEQSFIIDQAEIDKLDQATDKNNPNSHLIDVCFAHISENQGFRLQADSQQGIVKLYTDSIELAGDIIQDLGHYMNINELSSRGNYPIEMEQFQQVIKQVEEYRSSRMHITADIAFSVNQVKTFIVKAEDARVMSDMQYMRKYYTEVMNENKTLMTELTKRKQNNDILMDGLRQINAMISKASNLRIGQAKNKVTTLCRQAIKNKNLSSLSHIIETGEEF